MDNEMLSQVARAGIKFISKLAVNECTRRGFSPFAVQIKERIFAAINSGMRIEDAYELVFGKGSFRALAGEVYDAFNGGGKAVQS